MLGYLIFAAVVILLTVVALVAISRLRRKRVERRLRLEVTNEGNVRSRYELRAEDPVGALNFRFSIQGASLGEEAKAEPTAAAPQPSPSGVGTPPTTGKGLGQAADQALGCGTAISEILLTVGTLLPSPVSRPVMRLASTLRGGEVKAARIRTLPGYAGRLKLRPSASPGSPRPPQKGSTSASGERAAPAGTPAQGSQGPLWVQTPFLKPGETLALDLTVRSVRAGEGRDQPFRVISRCTEQADAAPVAQEGWVHITGGFLARPLLPDLVVVATAIGLLLAVYWLVSL